MIVSFTDNNNNPNTNCPNGNSYSRAINTLSFGGAGTATTSETPAACQFVCDSQASCVGFDWDYNPGLSIRCFIHTTATFGTKEATTNVDQYTLTNRCTTNPGGGNTPTAGAGMFEFID